VVLILAQIYVWLRKPKASALEESIIAQSAGSGTPGKVESSLDALLACIERK
jgi:hypothetical protein